MKPPPPGLYPGTPYAEYASWEAERSSILRLFGRSAFHAYAARVSPEGDKPSKAKDLGEASHCAILEPDQLEKRFVVWQGVSDGSRKNSRVGTAEWAAFVLGKGDRKIIEQKEMDKALWIRDGIWKQSWAPALLGGPGLTEASMSWIDPELGVHCKVRDDRLVDDFDGYPTIGEIKTSKDGSRRGWERAIDTFDYHVQAAMQLDCIRILDPDGADRYRHLWIVIENVSPYASGLYAADDETLEEGTRRYKGALAQLLECQRSGIWPGYPQRPVLVSLPPWAKGKGSGGSGVAFAQGGSGDDDDIF